MTVLSRGNLFPPELVSDLINQVKGESSLAKLSQRVPVAFDGNTEFTFNLDSDIDIVAEGGAKSHGGASLKPVTIVPIKVEYGARFSDEFMYATEERKIEIIKAFSEGYAKKLARGVDLMAWHGINPRTKTASNVINGNSFDGQVTQTVDFDKANPDANIETAVGLVQGSEGSVTGLAMDQVMSAALSAMRNGDGNRIFPELAWGKNPGTINGLASDINSTVSGGSVDLAIVGDFANMFKWGYAKEIPLEVIQYGDPDNSGRDLKGHNEVYLRSETFVGWGIMDPTQFARVIKPKVEA